MKDWSGNPSTYISTNGFANNNQHQREKYDYYATEPKAVELLLQLEDFSKYPIWECACGEGHLSKAMINKGLTVHSSDIINRGYGTQYDFLAIDNQEWNGHIITNPPYKYTTQFIEKALQITTQQKLIALLLPIRYTEGKARKQLFLKTPPKTIYVSSSRIKCTINGQFNKTNAAVTYAWFVWQKGYKDDTKLKWFN